MICIKHYVESRGKNLEKVATTCVNNVLFDNASWKSSFHFYVYFLIAFFFLLLLLVCIDYC